MGWIMDNEDTYFSFEKCSFCKSNKWVSYSIDYPVYGFASVIVGCPIAIVDCKVPRNCEFVHKYIVSVDECVTCGAVISKLF